MPGETKQKGWAPLRRELEKLPPQSLLALLKDLHDSSAENRTFLQARFHGQEAGAEALEKYRSVIVEQFFPRRGFGKLKLGEARKAIRDYRKASGDQVGTMELMLTYVENGTEFTAQFGDINEAFYNSLESALTDLCEAIRVAGPEAYARYRDRLQTVESRASGIGWGYGDFVNEQVFGLEDEFEGDGGEE